MNFLDIIKNLDLGNMYFTEIYNIMIHEPENIIDFGIVFNFYENQHIFRLNVIYFLKDLTRIY